MKKILILLSLIAVLTVSCSGPTAPEVVVAVSDTTKVDTSKVDTLKVVPTSTVGTHDTIVK